MCGIAGVVQADQVTVKDVEKMISTIGYRGPDEKGVHQTGPAIMGHARLAVVDPENGKQPMTNEDGSVWVSFNGEIYNYVELREELKKKGHVFKSRCDTEVLVHLWEEEGEAMLGRLIGMFAFFIWDEKKKKGILARDRQGIKPLYYASHKGGLAFCSEIKGILSLPGFEKRINKNTLLQVLAFNYPPPPETCFEGVRHLEPGTYLAFDGKSPKPQQKTYWKWPFLEKRETPSFEEFSALLDDAVRLQMRFDVKGGMFLSGGIDSSVVATHLVKQWKEPQLEAVSLDFKVSGFSELSYAKFVADKYKIKLLPHEIKSVSVPEIANKVVYHADQPHGDFSFFVFYLLSQEAHRQGKIVMFSGDGPDEAMIGFGQNERYFSGLGRMNFSMRSYFDLICYMKQDMREKLLQPSFLSQTDDPIEKFEATLAPWEELDPIEQISAYELTSLFTGNNQIKGDRMGACWSIEGRSPFLDHRVSELFVKLPIAEKFKDGKGKSYLKRYALRSYPEDFVYRQKTMPTMPIGEWLKGPLYDWARTTLGSGDDGIFNNQALLATLEDHRSGKRNYTSELRTTLMTKTWLKEFGL